MIGDIAEHYAAVVIALSDCGSCTSCSTHDLNDLDKRGGLAGVSVLTTEFLQAFEPHETSIGFDAASVYVSPSMQNKTTLELRECADLALEEKIQAIDETAVLRSDGFPGAIAEPSALPPAVEIH